MHCFPSYFLLIPVDWADFQVFPKNLKPIRGGLCTFFPSVFPAVEQQAMSNVRTRIFLSKTTQFQREKVLIDFN